MSFITLTGVNLAFGDRDILKEVDLTLSTKSRIALAGANGSGKTSLMRIAAGLSPPDSGSVHSGKEVRTAYLPQSGVEHTGTTLLEEAEKAFDYLRPFLEEKNTLEEQLGQVSEEDRQTQILLEKHHQLHEYLLSNGYYSREQETEKILTGLGFSPQQFHAKTNTFSSGWQMRIALAKILLEKPDIMLLDEPTNYLDIEARTWLEDFIQRYSGGICIVSHDRYFLDSTVNETAELFHARLTIYKGNYTAYEKRRAAEIETLYSEYEKQQEEIAKTEEFINRFRYNASKAKLVQSRIRQLEKIERIEIPEHLKKMSISFPSPPHSGRILAEARGLRKSYGGTAALSDVELSLERGEKLAVTGVNGAGKSTLLRIIAGVDTDFQGDFSYGSGVQVGYFSEEKMEQLDAGRNVLETVEASCPTDLIPKVRGMLGAFLFRGDDIYKKVAVLSGGEKNRLTLLTLLLRPANLLVLDEPTNHLDLHAKDVLLGALHQYNGTIVFVSHDRHFLENLATKVLELDNHRHMLYPGDYTYYLWKKNQGSSPSADNKETADDSPAGETGGKRSYEQEKQLRRKIQQLERREEQLLQQVGGLEEDCGRLQEKLNTPEVYSDPEKAGGVKKLIENNTKRQAELMKEWEQIEEQKKEYIE